MGVFWFILALLIVIMVHEAGHFTMAKKLGFKATKFYVGFGPPLWKRRKGETEYGIAAIPAGGYVKIVGMNPFEEVPPEDQPRSYPNKPIWQRVLVILGGPLTHWPLAFIVLFFAFTVVGYPTDKATNQIDAVEQGSPADGAGLEPGDLIVAVNGDPSRSWEATRGVIRSNANETVEFTVEREGERLDVEVPLGSALFAEDGRLLEGVGPGEDVRDPKEGEVVTGYLGVTPQAEVNHSPVNATTQAGYLVWDMTYRSVTSLGDVFAPLVNGDLIDAIQGERERPRGVGLVGAGRIANQAVDEGDLLFFLGFLANLTIFIGIMNLLPLPPLDGGHLAILAIEKVRGKPVDMRKVIPVAAAVISFFLIMFLAFLYFDLVKPLEVPL
jgi:membrane-associated protease RseP (regulator of RpoE activity)